MPWSLRFWNVFRADRLSEELDNEFEFHLAETTDRLMAEGMTEEEAGRQARLRLGNYGLQKERTRDMDVSGWLDAVRTDVPYGLRQLRLNPGFAAVAVLSLALGIGANTAIFQLLDALRLRGVPVKDPSRLVTLERTPDFFTEGWYASRNQAYSYAQMEALRRDQKAFSEVLTFWPRQFNLSAGGRSRYAEGLFVSPNFLRVLGVEPIVGSGLSADGDKTVCTSATAVLSYGFWQSEFGGDPRAIGKTISLDARRFTIGGVTPGSFTGVEPGQRFDVALPLCATNVFDQDGKGPAFNDTAFWLTPIARLKPGWSVERAAANIRDSSPAIFRETLPSAYRPEDAKRYLKNKFKVTSASAGISNLRKQYENPLWILMAITGSVLLIACANLANLLLARASVRAPEMAIRQAVGASRSRLIGQLLAESLLLAVAGAALGLCLAQALNRALIAFLSTDKNPVAMTTGVDWHVFLFLTGITVVTCVLFGLAPAIRGSAGTPSSAMHGARTSTAARERNSLRRALVASQVALSLMLLVAALLFTRSLQNLLAANLGFDSRNVLVADVTASGSEAATPERQRLLERELEAHFRSLGGVASAATVLFTPFSGFGWLQPAYSDNDKAKSGGNQSWFNRAGPGYFRTMGTRLLAGRDFNSHDDLRAPIVAIVNETFAKTFFGGRNPVGRSFRIEGDAGEPDTVAAIVGLVEDTKYNQLGEQKFCIGFFPMDQNKLPGNRMSFVIRGRGSLEPLQSSIEREVTSVNPNLLVDLRVLRVQIGNSVLRERLMANLSAGFGILAGCLSTLGLYGVMSYIVARRRMEIGVRIALGAQRGDVYRLIAKDAAAMVTTGLLAGVIGSLLLSRYAESLLFGLKARDPLTLVLAGALLSVTAAVATLAPARRAAHLEPVTALRQE